MHNEVGWNHKPRPGKSWHGQYDQVGTSYQERGREASLDQMGAKV